MVRAVFGYIDPGSGTILLQVLMATLIGTIAFVGKIRQTIISLIRMFLPRASQKEVTNDSPSEEVPKRQAA